MSITAFNCSTNLIGALTADLIQRAQEADHKIITPFDDDELLATIVSCHGVQTTSLVAGEEQHGSDDGSSADISSDDSITSLAQDNNILHFNNTLDSFLDAADQSACQNRFEQNNSCQQAEGMTTVPQQEGGCGQLGDLLDAWVAQNSV